MTWVRRQSVVPVHECDRPMREVVYTLPSQFVEGGDPLKHRERVPDGQEGDLWRCPVCRALWLIALGRPRCTWDGYCGRHYAGLILRAVWMPARWWQKIIYARTNPQVTVMPPAESRHPHSTGEAK